MGEGAKLMLILTDIFMLGLSVFGLIASFRLAWWIVNN